MFMRSQGHTCSSCQSIEEAHYQRHKKIVKRIRDIYKDGGKTDWTGIPCKKKVLGTDMGLSESDKTSHISSTKRERKTQKQLARAALRYRVISQDEISHIEAVIHSVDSLSGADVIVPHNTGELKEIGHQLNLTADVYMHSGRQGLKKPSRISGIDIDFHTAIERIFDAFRVNELVKDNSRNQGLQRKYLKAFQSSVPGLKEALVEDLVLVKRDELETRMRRAGYLRYTSKASHNIIEDRYSEKNWKTGEKHVIIFGGSSDSDTIAEESSSLLRSVHRLYLKY
jgi:hypothetical protein